MEDDDEVAPVELDDADAPGCGYPDECKLNAWQFSFIEFCDKAQELYVDLQNSATDDEEASRAALFY